MTRLKGELIDQYRLLNEQYRRYRRGSTVRKYARAIAEIVQEIPTETILDYGSGAGEQYKFYHIHEAWGIKPVLFDPAVPGIDRLPKGTFDGVICTGVLEHIPLRELDMAIGNLARYARKWAVVVVGTGPSPNKRLPNGQNVHVTIKPADWWRPRLRAAFAPHVRLWLGFIPS